ncbi:MAG TPA: hypothetical protein VFV22_02085 [Candidatus Paceibacterota bacterium]|nr:hypothetical protein [Candidatus Paceibacterota bacterium]
MRACFAMMWSTYNITQIRKRHYITYYAWVLCAFVVMSLLVALPLAPVFADEVALETLSSPTDTETVHEANVGEQMESTFDASPVPPVVPSVDVDTTTSQLEPENSVPVIMTEADNNVDNNHAGLIEVDENFDQSPEHGVSDNSREDQSSENEDILSFNNGSGDAPPLVANEDSVFPEVSSVVDEGGSTPLHEVHSDTDVSDAAAYTEPAQPLINTVTNDENRLSFAQSECATMDDGTYYCVKQKEESEIVYTDRVYSAPDEDGDLEIFIEKGGDITQITRNTFDDDAPYFDESTNTITWHRLIDGRYQIMIYDIEHTDEQQITFDRYNNMHPSRFGEITVWQGWIGNDWEIFMMHGTDEPYMLTDNVVHDISPQINGTHVVWQSFEHDVWVMKVYDIRTKHTETIEGNDGGTIENPRFVLVYDSKSESGDVLIRGYDLGSGENIELGAKPVSLPDEIPDPEQTGQKRALVSQTPQLKEKQSTVEGDGSPDDSTNDSNIDISESDIVVTPYVPITDDDTSLLLGATTTVGQYQNTSYDISMSTQSSSTLPIHDESTPYDLIITPYIEPLDDAATTSNPQQ